MQASCTCSGKLIKPQSTLCPLSKCIDTWATELQGDPEEQFILDGLKNGFALTDINADIPITPVEVENCKSAVSDCNKHKVETQINIELAEGNYVKTLSKPHIVSAIGAIEKPDGSVRLIHDASRPEGQSLNDLASREPCKFQTFNDVINILIPDGYCAKIDLKCAYRSCGIRDCDTNLTGLKWKFAGSDKYVYIKDTKLPYGARKSVYHFNKLTQAVKRFMKKRNFNVVAYIDDFLLVEKDFKTCLASFNTLLRLLRSLGFSINWKKVVDPTQTLTFLGIQINTHAGTLTLDEKKATCLVDTLKNTLKRTRLSKNQLQSIAGKLAWASIVTPWGKTHTCLFFRVLSMLKKPSHKVKIVKLYSSIKWWLGCLNIGNNCRLIWDSRPMVSMCTDASDISGGGFCQNGDWLYKHWAVDEPQLAKAHINLKELYMGVSAVARWAPVYPNTRLCLFMDNIASTCIINKGSSRNMHAIHCMRKLSIVALRHNVAVEAFYIPGVFNDIADSISRFHMDGQIARFISLLHMSRLPRPINGYWLHDHMSKNAQICISSQIMNWVKLHKTWTLKWLNSDHYLWQSQQGQTISATRGHICNSAETRGALQFLCPQKTCADLWPT